MRSIKNKLIMLFGGMITIICLGLCMISYISSTKALKANVETTLPQIAAQTANFVNSEVQGVMTKLQATAERPDLNDPSISIYDKAPVLKFEAERNNALRMIYADAEKNTMNQDGVFYSPTEDAGYFTAMTGVSNVSNPRISKASGNMVVVYSVPVKYNGEIVGVLSETRDANAFSDMTDKVNFGETGKAYIVNSEGVIIAHHDRDLVTNMENVFEKAKEDESIKDFANAVEKIISGGTGVEEYTLSGEKFMVGYSPIEGTDWFMAVEIERNEILSQVIRLRYIIEGVSVVFLGLGIIFVYKAATLISNRIKANSDHLALLAQGDLTVEIAEEYLKDKSETGEMAGSMKKMQESLRKMMETIKDSASNINSQSENLSSISEEIASSSQNVTEAITDVAHGAGTQADSINMIVDILDKFSEKLSGMVQNVHTVDSNSREIGNKASKSNDEMNELNKSLDTLGSTFEAFNNKISEFGQDVKKIDEIIRLIDDVAEQTNLLALNAAIEAARAGESGRGFAVVAEEIGALAEQSKRSAENISRLIEVISKNTDAIVNDSVEIDNVLKNQAETINSSINSFREIINGVDEMIPQIDTLKVSAEDIEQDKNTILKRIDGLSEIAVDVSSSAEEISASSEEMNATTEEVASSAQILSGMTNDMMEEVNKFKL